MDTKGGNPWGGGDGGVMNWAIGIDMYTLMCIKLVTNKNLLYKKINKIKFKKKKKERGSQSYRCKKLNSANNLNEYGKRFSQEPLGRS